VRCVLSVIQVDLLRYRAHFHHVCDTSDVEAKINACTFTTGEWELLPVTGSTGQQIASQQCLITHAFLFFSQVHLMAFFGHTQTREKNATKIHLFLLTKIV
jgi:hypothetical protein